MNTSGDHLIHEFIGYILTEISGVAAIVLILHWATLTVVRLILYSKPGCHLCEGLQEKLEQIQSLKFELEIRDITTRDDWFQAYQYEVPVLFAQRQAESLNEPMDETIVPPASGANATEPGAVFPIPRPSPRATVRQLEQLLSRWVG